MGFKWFVDGLLDGGFGFGGEESAGASFLRRDGTAWTTDKDGIILGLLAAEITAVTGKDPGALLPGADGEVRHVRITSAWTRPPRRRRRPCSQPAPEAVTAATLAGEHDHRQAHPRAGQRRAHRRAQSGHGDGWFAARPSGTEDVYKIYAESFNGEDTWRNRERGPGHRQRGAAG